MMRMSDKRAAAQAAGADSSAHPSNHIQSIPPPRRSTRHQNPAGAVDATTRSRTKVYCTVSPGKTAKDLPSPHVVHPLPGKLTAKLTKLSAADHRLLLRKQASLRKYTIEPPTDFLKHRRSVESTLVFAQEEAGTAVCVSSDGLLLTCAHCVSDDDEARPDPERVYWLLFESGRAVAARCIDWNKKMDLALLRVTAAQADPRHDDGAAARFPSVPVWDSSRSERPARELICVGHPGSEDLETDEPGVKTGYPVLQLSEGVFRGYADGQDRLDNEDIGALKHDCWTYWGHSGAPLFDRATGRLFGLHSSWDEETGMRRGVSVTAIENFVPSYPVLPVWNGDDDDDS